MLVEEIMNSRVKHCLVSVPDTTGANPMPQAVTILKLAGGFLLQAPVPSGSRAFSGPRQGRRGCWGGEGRLMPLGAALSQQLLAVGG